MIRTLPPFLEDVRQLCERGDPQTALELVDLWLEDHPDDGEARLLKAETCLNAAQNYAYVGQLLIDCADEHTERLDQLRRRSSDLAWGLIAKGRERLRARHPDEALENFDAALALHPIDPVIALAAGLALIRSAHEPVASRAPSPFDELRRRAPPESLSAEIEKYLRLVVEQTLPDERPYEVAAAALVRQWLTEGALSLELLALLTSIPAPIPSTLDLIAEVSEQISTRVLDTLANLLRIDLPEKADLLLKSCRRAGFATARLHLYAAERLADQPARALAAYRKALARSGRAQLPLSLDAARTLLIVAQGIQARCPHCGKNARPNESLCPFCESSLLRRRLLVDEYPDVPDALLARIGMAEMLANKGDTVQAREYWQAVVDALPGDHWAIKPLQALHERIVGETQIDRPSLAILRSFDGKNVSMELLAQIQRVNQGTPEDWFVVPLAQRAKWVRWLIDVGQLKIARETLGAAFADQPGRKVVADLAARLDEGLRRNVDAVLNEAGALMAAARASEAILRTSQVLELCPDPRLYFARGQARLSLGEDLSALEDFYAAETAAETDGDRQAARKAAALVLERRWNVSGARALLALLDPADPDVVRAQARLQRREQGEPFVLAESAPEGVMEDTLTRRALSPYYQGYFALAVRAVGYGSGESWVRRLIDANTEFVRVLGALRDVMGDALFVLRTISQPHRQIPERGSLTVALLVRVAAEDEASCRARALQLWTDIHAILPLAQENVYVFEPVVDEDELRALLTPFEPAHTAEISHHEFIGEGVYTANPFMTGTLDLHSLHWVLLRQSDPAMISIHLKPTNLLPWERTATSEENHAFSEYGLLDAVSPGADTMSQYLGRVQLWQKIQMRQVQLTSLQSPYLLRVFVAGSAGTSQLLPDMAAAALFQPLADSGQKGGYTIARANSPHEIAVMRRNLSALDVEAWTASAERFPYLVGEVEAAQVFRLPIPTAEGVPGMALLEGKPVVPPVGMPDGGTRLGLSVARIKGVPLPVTQGEDDRRRHLYVVGKTGMGKSTLLLTLILQDIDAGRGVFLLDPHGDLCEDVLARIPAQRAADVILLDPSDSERPLGLNILNAETEADRDRVVNEFIGLLTRLYDPYNQAIVGPIFQQNVRNAMLAAMALPDGTLIDVYRLLSDGRYIQRVLPHIKDPLVKNYWEEIAARVDSSASSQWKAELLPYLLSKFSRFVEDSTLRRMIGQPRTSIPWGGVIDESKILLVNLAKGRIGQENSQFIGSLVLSSMLQAAFRRGELPAARRKDFYLYIDEVQNYATPLLATMLSEGRKFGVILTIANQFLHQLDHGTREAVFGNVGSLVAFRVGTQDAPTLAPEFYPVFSPGDLLNLPQFTACVKLLIDGVAARPFSMRTLPALIAPDDQRAAQIRERSRQRYGTAIADVQQTILKKF